MGRNDNRRTRKVRRKTAQRKKKLLLKKRIAEKLTTKPMNKKGAVGTPSVSVGSTTAVRRGASDQSK